MRLFCKIFILITLFTLSSIQVSNYPVNAQIRNYPLSNPSRISLPTLIFPTLNIGNTKLYPAPTSSIIPSPTINTRTDFFLQSYRGNPMGAAFYSVYK